MGAVERNMILGTGPGETVEKMAVSWKWEAGSTWKMSPLNLQAPSLTGENSLGQYFQPWGFSKRGKKKREEMLYVVSTRV
jgi:hypothetical protein